MARNSAVSAKKKKSSFFLCASKTNASIFDFDTAWELDDGILSICSCVEVHLTDSSTFGDIFFCFSHVPIFLCVDGAKSSLESVIASVCVCWKP